MVKTDNHITDGKSGFTQSEQYANDALRAENKQLHQNFQQLQDQVEELEKSNIVLWKVISFLMENI
jgi:cell division protein FtsB